MFAGRVFTHTHAAGVLLLTLLIQTLVVAYEVGRRAGHKHDECTGGEQEALQDGKLDTKHKRRAEGDGTGAVEEEQEWKEEDEF